MIAKAISIPDGSSSFIMGARDDARDDVHPTGVINI